MIVSVEVAQLCAGHFYAIHNFRLRRSIPPHVYMAFFLFFSDSFSQTVPG